MKTLPLVIKMGGRLLQERPALDALLAVCHQLKQQRPVVLVHGGGDQVDQWLARFGFTTEKIDGQRVSPAEQMPVITGALDGAVNAGLVSRAMLQGLNPVGLNLSAGSSLQFTVNSKLGAVGLAKAKDS
ncbi:TPA: acetylglutamate kinase, partial [Candidatus Azambacteria bacterium]|nr:acetylglutamate kinase [Candidatus Azambacteria bacterium]